MITTQSPTARESARETLASLQSRLHGSSAVEFIVLLPLIQRAAELLRDIGVYDDAYAEDIARGICIGEAR